MDKQGPPYIVHNTIGNTSNNSVNTQCAQPRLLLVYLVTLSTMLCILVSEWKHVHSVCVGAEHLGGSARYNNGQNSKCMLCGCNQSALLMLPVAVTVTRPSTNESFQESPAVTSAFDATKQLKCHFV